MTRESAVRVAVVHPDLLGTYGDGGNGRILTRRLVWRGIDAELVEVPSGSPVPTGCDIYCLGGGEDGPQLRAAAELAADGTIRRAVEAGAALLAVCAGFQVAGHSFPAADGSLHDGLGLLDVNTRKGAGPRAVGEVVAEPAVEGLPLLTGYENHAGATTLGPGAAPLGRVTAGVGNGGGDGTEGAVNGRVFATYLHGPVLARNPALADMVLARVVGALSPLDDSEADSLRQERLRAAGARSRGVGVARRRLPGGRLLDHPLLGQRPTRPGLPRRGARRGGPDQ